MHFSHSPAKLLLLFTSLAFVIGGAALFLGLREWRYHQLQEEAGTAVRAGDFDQAALSLLVLEQRYGVDASWLRLKGDLLQAQGDPEVVELRRRLLEMEGTSENRLAYGVALVSFDQMDRARLLLDGWPKADRQDAPYLNLRGILHFIDGDWAAAHEIFQALHTKADDNIFFAYNLAAIGLRLEDPDREQAGIRLLERLRQGNGLPGQSERILLEAAGALGRSDWLDRVDLWIGDLEDPTRLQMELDTLDTRRLLGSLTPDQLQQAKVRAERSLLAYRALASWLLETGHTGALLSWVREWDDAVLDDPVASMLAVEGLDRAEAYHELYSLLRDRFWPGREFMRYAFLAQAEDHLMSENRTAANPWWGRAIQHAVKTPQAFYELARQLTRWDQQTILERLLAASPEGIRGQPAFQNLELTLLEAQGRTRELLERFQAKLAAEPDNVVLKNNVAALGLLLDPGNAEYRQMADANFRRVPDHPDLAATWALSHIDSDPAGVKERLEPLLDRFPNHEGLLLYFGEAHRLLGEINPVAARYSDLAASDTLFPEERLRLEQWSGSARQASSRVR